MFENPKGSPFSDFSALCYFSSDIRFSQYISTNIFFQYYPKFERNIRIFDVISEIYSVSLRRRRKFENKVLAFVPAAISELLKHFPSTEGFLCVKLFCEFFLKKRQEHILKILQFLSLRSSADFGRSRLVSTLD